MEMDSGSLPIILCCLCGIEIHQNPANMCVSCLRSSVDITEGLNRQLTIHSCRSCGRFLCPPWQSLALESKELMAVCLRKIAGLSSVKLIDAVWIWTEPHSMRLKIKLTIQKEVMNGAILQQAAVIDFVIRNQQCRHCEASYAQGSWHAVVQVRQRVSHKRTFFFIEQMILKHHAHSDCIKIVTFKDGIDFYFTDKNQAVKFIDFLQCNAPTKVKYARKLVTADHKDNTGDFKHNYILEIAPICKDDLVVLPKPLAQNLSNIRRLVLVKRVGAGIHVIDPLTGERSEVNNEKYWRYEFPAALSSKQLIKYIVLSVEPIVTAIRPSAKVRGNGDRKIRVAECVVARERDFGVNDTQFTVTTHLGNLLKEGDEVMGYDFTNTNWNMEEDIESVKLGVDLPDLVLVRKYYGGRGERKWMLKKLEADETHDNNDEELDEEREEFMQEIEGDKEMRANIRMYKKNDQNVETSSVQHRKSGNAAAASDSNNSKMVEDNEDDLDDEEVRLDELLDDLTLINADETSAVILNKDDAAKIPGMTVETSGFDASDFDTKKFKFL